MQLTKSERKHGKRVHSTASLQMHLSCRVPSYCAEEFCTLNRLTLNRGRLSNWNLSEACCTMSSRRCKASAVPSRCSSGASMAGVECWEVLCDGSDSWTKIRARVRAGLQYECIGHVITINAAFNVNRTEITRSRYVLCSISLRLMTVTGELAEQPASK